MARSSKGWERTFHKHPEHHTLVLDGEQYGPVMYDGRGVLWTNRKVDGIWIVRAEDRHGNTVAIGRHRVQDTAYEMARDTMAAILS